MSGFSRLRRRRSGDSEAHAASTGTTTEPTQARPARDPDDPLRIAAITFCRDEGRMLPLWLRYYGGELGVEHLYVVDDSSEDGSTEDLPCDVLRIPPIRGGKFNSTRMAVVGNLGRALLQLYDVVLFCDTDEFIVPDPDKWAGLREYIEARDVEGLGAVGSLGFNVVQHVGVEGPLDTDQPLLGQRRLAKFLPLMCKPAIKWSPEHWSSGTHGVRTPYRVDPELWMFHMKFGDRDHLQEAADHRLRMVEADGRSRDTQWRQGGDTLVGMLEEITTGVEADLVPEFVAPVGDALDALVIEDPPGNFRAPRSRQLKQMRIRPLVRIPARFYGVV